MVHKRSQEAQARRRVLRRLRHEALTFVHTRAFKDIVYAEVVSRVDKKQILNHLSFTYPQEIEGYKYVGSHLPDIDRGEVLSDSRGQGTLQKVTA